MEARFAGLPLTFEEEEEPLLDEGPAGQRRIIYDLCLVGRFLPIGTSILLL